MSKIQGISAIFAIVLALWGAFELFGKSPSDELVGTGLAVQQNATQQSGLARSDQEFICRAAIAELMGRSVNIINVDSYDGGEIRTSYNRPSDGIKWSNLCKITGDRVIWASIENNIVGRWRNSAADEVVTFSINEELVTITQRFGDGSSMSDTFTRDN